MEVSEKARYNHLHELPGSPSKPRQKRHVRFWWALAAIATVFLIFHRRTQSHANRSRATSASDPILGQIAWETCPPEIDSELFDCGRLAAPLDYHFDSDKRHASIYVVRYMARVPGQRAERTSREDVLGTIILNPGGPGASGVDFVSRRRAEDGGLARVEMFNSITRGRYDYLSFDPRGVGRTWPTVMCHARPEDECTSDLVAQSYGLLHALPGGEQAQLGEILSSFELRGAVCAANATAADALRFVGTTAVARDMRLLYRAVGDTAWNYWGFSYGTVLGMTFADMFPDEVGHGIIDGVMNATQYMRGEWGTIMRDTDAEYEHFIRECAEAGAACGLTKGLLHDASSTKALARAVHARVEHFLARLLKQPQVVANASHPGLLTWSMAKQALFLNLYVPTTWNTFAQDLQAAIEGNYVPLYEKNALTPCEAGKRAPGTAVTAAAIECGDVTVDYDLPTVDRFRKLLRDYERKSKHFGAAFMWGIGSAGTWPIRSSELHKGNYTAHTKRPLLFLGNEYDPVTPHAHAEYQARRFPGASFAMRKGYGHCTPVQKSRCIENVAADYFINDKLPDFGHVCPWDEKEQPLFHGADGAALHDTAVSQAQEGDGGALLALVMEDMVAFAPGRPGR